MAIALYARQSVERENSISCETQLEYCKAVIKPDERHEELLIFVDNGRSGGNLDREGFQKLMRHIERREISKVIVYKLDRISRSLGDFVNILREFKANGVEFVSSQESFDTSSPYGELIVKILMVFAEFERTSIINRITQAYSHRSEMGFYMGGRQPYGFKLVPAVIGGVRTKKLSPIPAEIRQLQYIFEAYAREGVSLRGLRDILTAEGQTPRVGGAWTASKLSGILKNPIYVKADSDVYDYYESRGVQIITDISLFKGEHGAQLYGRTKHDPELPDWSDMKLVLLTHDGVISSDIWLKCGQKLERNRKAGTSVSNRTSWLSGKLVCEKCGHNMTTIKGKPNREGETRRYFNCTGKSHKKICEGPGATIYAEALENMVCGCIAEKLSELKGAERAEPSGNSAAANSLKLRLREVEKNEKQLVEKIMSGGLNDDMLTLLNSRASQLGAEKSVLIGQLKEVTCRNGESALNLAQFWVGADYRKKREVAAVMIHKLFIGDNGDVKIIWNI